ncbi:peptidylprolyl isomerase [Paenibacillus sp. CMAA1364]
MQRVIITMASIVIVGIIVTATLLSIGDIKALSSGANNNISSSIKEVAVEANEVQLISQLYSTTQGDLDVRNGEVMNKVRMVKATQQVAMDYGIMKDNSYKVFVKELDLENDRRATALRDKQVIYGPKEYSEQTYYDYRYAMMMNELKLAWIAQELEITEDALLEYYLKNRGVLASKQDTITIHKIIQPIQGNRAEAEREMSGIIHKTINVSAFNTEFNRKRSTMGLTEIEIIDDNNYRDISKYRNSYYSLITEMKVGEISDVMEENDSLFILMVSDRQVTGYRMFEEVREEVIQRYKDDSFDAHIKQIASHIVINLIEED